MRYEQLRVGQRVELINGVYAGEKATVVPNPESGQHQHRDEVWIRFDHHNAHLGRERGWAILSPQWFDLEDLKKIR